LKYIVQTVLTFFLLLFAGAFFLQTPIAKRQIKEILLAAAKEEGVHLDIASVDGSLPFDWKLKGVRIHVGDEILSVKTLRARCAIFPLFKKQLEISHLKMEGAHFAGIPFEGTAKGKFDLQGKKPIKIHHLLIEGEDLYFHFEGKICPNWDIEEGNFAFHLPELSPFHPAIKKGSTTGEGTILNQTAHFECVIEEAILFDREVKSTVINLDATRKNLSWKGSAKVDGGTAEVPIDGRLDFRFTPSCHLLAIEKFRFQGPQLELFGKIDLETTFKCLEGAVFAQFLDLSTLRPLFPNSYLKGRLGAKIDFQSFSKFQDLKVQVEGEGIAFYDTSIETFSFESALYDLFGDMRGELSIEGEKCSLPQMELSHVAIKSHVEPHASPLEVLVKGTWKEPFELHTKGSWQRRGLGYFFNIHSLYGHGFHSLFNLKETFTLEWGTEQFKLNNFAIDIGKGSLAAHIDLSEHTSQIKIKASEFPLEFIALPRKHVSLSGTGNLDLDLVSWETTSRATPTSPSSGPISGLMAADSPSPQKALCNSTSVGTWPKSTESSNPKRGNLSSSREACPFSTNTSPSRWESTQKRPFAASSLQRANSKNFSTSSTLASIASKGGSPPS
jgi:hypothetical protein